MRVFGIIVALLLPLSGFAADAPLTLDSPASPRATVKQTANKNNRPPSYWSMQLGPKFVFWQETILSTGGATPTEFPTQFYGVSATTTFRKSINSLRWYQAHSIDVMLGQAHGYGNDLSAKDNLRNQPWYGFLASPGILYRTTTVSDVTLSVPFSYRKISWTDQATLKFGKESLFSYGLGLNGVIRLSAATQFVTRVVYQADWASTMWMAGFDFSI